MTVKPILIHFESLFNVQRKMIVINSGGDNKYTLRAGVTLTI